MTLLKPRDEMHHPPLAVLARNFSHSNANINCAFTLIKIGIYASLKELGNTDFKVTVSRGERLGVRVYFREQRVHEDRRVGEVLRQCCANPSLDLSQGEGVLIISELPRPFTIIFITLPDSLLKIF